MDVFRWRHALSPCEPLTSVEQPIRLGQIIAVGQNEDDTPFAVDDGEPIEGRVFVSHASPQWHLNVFTRRCVGSPTRSPLGRDVGRFRPLATPPLTAYPEATCTAPSSSSCTRLGKRQGSSTLKSRVCPRRAGSFWTSSRPSCHRCPISAGSSSWVDRKTRTTIARIGQDATRYLPALREPALAGFAGFAAAVRTRRG